MDLTQFEKQFMEAKDPMPLNQAATYIRQLRENYPMLGKTWTFNRLEYNHRLAMQTACEELEDILRNAAPWKDYREIIAECIWPYMRRVLRHKIDGWYDGLYGTKWGIADAWFVELWLAYDEIFRRMPGKIPDTTPWRIFDSLVYQTERVTRNYRRNL